MPPITADDSIMWYFKVICGRLYKAVVKTGTQVGLIHVLNGGTMLDLLLVVFIWKGYIVGHMTHPHPLHVNNIDV